MGDSGSEVDEPAPKKGRGRAKKTKAAPLHTKLLNPEITGPRTVTPKSEFISQRKWSSDEKKKLLKALKTCVSETDMTKVYEMVPTRKPQEVEAEVQRIRNSVLHQDVEFQAPIESWLDFAQEMVNYEVEDHSKSLARAMSMVSNYETFKTQKDGPAANYKLIYAYLAAVLRDQEPPKLSPMESFIMKELLQDLASMLAGLDARTQRNVMTWKYSMLNCKVDVNNLKDSVARVRRALTNMFPEDLVVGTSDQAKSRSGPSTSTPLSGTGSSATSTNTSTNTSMQTTSSTSSDLPASSRTSVVDASTPTSFSAAGSPRSSTTADPETGSDSEVQIIPGPSGCWPVGNDNTDTVAPVVQKRRPGRPKKNDRDDTLRKPALYTLNPFCIPVDILKIPKNQTAGSRKRTATKKV